MICIDFVKYILIVPTTVLSNIPIRLQKTNIRVIKYFSPYIPNDKRIINRLYYF